MFKIHELLEATGGKLISGKRDLRVSGISIDSRTISPKEAFIAIKGNNFDGHNFIGGAIERQASCIIKESRYGLRNKNYGLRTAVIEVKNTLKALGDISKLRRNKFNIPVIAITGSNGKTTTKEMIAWVLSRSFNVIKNEGTKNNQVGLPLTLLNIDLSCDIAVVELGTNRPGEIEYLARISKPNIGIITNIGPSHFECLRNLEGVFNEKQALIKNLKKPYLAILNSDDSRLMNKTVGNSKKPFVLSFGIKHRSDFSASNIKMFKRKLEFLVNQKYKFTLRTLGYYNIYNALAAIVAARLFGMEYKDIVDRLSDFDFPSSRLKLMRVNDIQFIDDTYNSNPLSLKQALDMLANFGNRGRKIFIMGDMLELGNRKNSFHYRAGVSAAKSCDVFITVGKLSEFAAKAAMISGLNVKHIFRCETTDQAREILFHKISPRKNDIVLVKGSRAMKMEEIFK